MVKGVSIVLCTYNGRALLKSTFEHLVAQKFYIPFELILVDNASKDGTKQYADLWWVENGPDNIDYRSFVQPVPGKSYAQDLGYEKARYEYIVVCDDDNWLCNTYVQTAYDIMEGNYKIGALGGWGSGVFESDKPEWFDAFAKFYAVAKQGKNSGDITNKKGCLYGAGMVIRKSHWLQMKELGFEHLLSCRKGDSLSSGGDTEYCYALRLLDYKIWYDERLYFKHFMTNNRLNFNYLSRLRKAFSYSNFMLWPYLDLLRDTKRSRKDFFKAAFRDITSNGTRKTVALFFGNFNEKELAKLYFRYLKYKLFCFGEYKKNFTFLVSWARK